MSKVKDGLPEQKEGLPAEAFAIVGDREDSSTWKLPHHTKAIWRKQLSHWKSTDWHRLPVAVASLSEGGYRGQQVEATAEQKRKAAHHLAEHYRKAGKEVPDTLREYD